jgi:prevent-host-death family protein
MTAKPERTVKVAELKSKLSEFLRAVRGGHPVTVCDRDTPIARIVPYEAGPESLAVRSAARALHSLALPKPLGRRVNSLAALLDERQMPR